MTWVAITSLSAVLKLSARLTVWIPMSWDKLKWCHWLHMVLCRSTFRVSRANFLLNFVIWNGNSGSQTFDVTWTGSVTSDSPLKGVLSSTTTVRIDQDVQITHEDYFYWSWWIIALIAFGIMFSFVLILSTLYLCGFFQRRNHFAC